MNKIKQNDEVIVISGKDKGSVGTVTKVMGLKLIVEGFNIVKNMFDQTLRKGYKVALKKKRCL